MSKKYIGLNLETLFSYDQLDLLLNIFNNMQKRMIPGSELIFESIYCHGMRKSSLIQRSFTQSQSSRLESKI